MNVNNETRARRKLPVWSSENMPHSHHSHTVMSCRAYNLHWGGILINVRGDRRDPPSYGKWAKLEKSPAIGIT